MVIKELPACWAGLTCLEKLAFRLAPLDLRSPQNLEKVASTVKELAFSIERNADRMSKYMVQNCLKYEGLPRLFSIDFCIRLGEEIESEAEEAAVKAVREQCSSAAEGCEGVTLHASHAIFENLPDIF